jgi:hypothetical protein
MEKLTALIDGYTHDLAQAREHLAELYEQVDNEEWDEDTDTRIAEEELAEFIYARIIKDLKSLYDTEQGKA